VCGKKEKRGGEGEGGIESVILPLLPTSQKYSKYIIVATVKPAVDAGSTGQG